MPTKFRRAVLFTLALCAIAALTNGALAQVDPSEARMRKDITFLASDECEGRGVGTKGLDLAADYIAKQFKDAGLKPGGVDGTYFQPFPFSGSAELNGTSTLVLHGPQGQKIKLKQGPDFHVVGFSGPGKLTAPLVFAGYGVTAKTIDYDDYKGLDAKGKAVVTLRRLPRWSSKESPFDGANKDELASIENKQRTAHASQAAAVILVNDESDTPKDALLPFAMTAKENTTISIPYIQIKRSVIDDILRSSTGMGLAETEKAINGDLKPRSALTGWTAELNVRINRQKAIVKNIIGVVEGKGPLANETVVIGAHYDHVGYGEVSSLGGPDKQGDIHHGADDNGSGTTSIIELARRFGAMKDREGRRLVFMTFTAEERGLIGSRHYTRAPLFPLKDTTAMVNLDMVGRVKPTKDGSPPKLLVLGTDSSKDFDSLVKKHNPGFNLVKDTNPAAWFGSDHFSFYQQKIPVIFFWTGTHPDYHRPTDTADKINVAGMKKVADLTERVVASLSTEAARPDFLPVKSAFKAGGGKKTGGDGPRLGFRPDYSFQGKGVFVQDVSDGGPAQEAGLKANDVIIEVAGKSVANLTAFQVAMRQQKANVAIEITVIRDKKELKLKATPK